VTDFAYDEASSDRAVALEDDAPPKDAAELQERWSVEMAKFEKFAKRWHRDAEKTVKRYLDQREAKQNGDTRLNVYTSTIDVKRAVLLDKPPSCDVSRRFSDADDQEGRVASEMLERILNTDVERRSDTTELAFELAVEDRLVPGLAVVRAVYSVRFKKRKGKKARSYKGEERPETEVPEGDEKEHEDVEARHVHWRDFRWSPTRSWPEMRWVAYGADMTKTTLKQHFGARAKDVPFEGRGKKNRDSVSGGSVDGDAAAADPYARARVWEIWDKETRRVYWFAAGMDGILKVEDDPLELEGFWPMPRPLISHATSSAWLPRPDWCLMEDIYERIDMMETRIGLLIDAVRVCGLYDKEQPEIARLVGEADVNELYPVDNWAMLAEKGGLKGVVDWFPLEQIVAATNELIEKRQGQMDLLYQLDGTADLLRGQAAAAETATKSRISSRAMGVRIQRLQNELARFVGDYMAVKAEIISRHYDDGTIIARSNIDRTPDFPLAAAAIKLLREDFSCYRISVRPEALAMTDFDAVKQERAEFMEGVAKFLTAAAPLAQQSPDMVPFLLEMLKHFIAGFRGATILEGIADRAIDDAKKKLQAAAQNPQAQQDPAQAQLQVEQGKAKIKLQLLQQTAQVKGQQDQQHAQLEAQQRAQEQQSELQAKEQERALDHRYDMQELQEKTALEEQRDARRNQEREAQQVARERQQSQKQALRPGLRGPR
jgi:hypothetical protein